MTVNQHLVYCLGHFVPVVLRDEQGHRLPVIQPQLFCVDVKGTGQDTERNPAPFHQGLINSKDITDCSMLMEKTTGTVSVIAVSRSA